MLEMLVKPISDIVGKTLDKFVKDADLSERLKAEITKDLISAESEELKQRVSVIVAEAKGESWLQRNWRPLVMIDFAILITAYWLGYTAANLPESQILALLEIVKVGLGGYVVGRSVEKAVKAYKS